MTIDYPIKDINVKVGTAAISKDDGNIDEELVEHLVKSIVELKEDGRNVIITTSGAIGMGKSKIKLSGDDEINKQTYAAIGQHRLMGLYSKYFDKYKIETAQFLLTKEDFEGEKYENLFNGYNNAIENGIVPIINENDPVCIEEIRVGDNDNLASLVTEKLGQDLLIFLTRYEGLLRNGNTVLNPTKSPVCFNHKLYDLKEPFMTGFGGIETKLAVIEKVVNQSKKPCIVAKLDKRYGLKEIMLGNDKDGNAVKRSIFWPEELQAQYNNPNK